MGTRLPLRITVVRPPAGVTIQLQRGRAELLPPTHITIDEISFDFEVRVEPGPNFLGEYTQGPKNARFIYVNSGIGAGQPDSCWDRRAKVALMTITKEQIELAQSKPHYHLEARIEGTARDGGPMCATVPLIGGFWQLKPASEPGFT